MKITINFDTKEITLDSTISLGEFIDKIIEILPDYKEYKLRVNSTIIPSYPRIEPFPNNPFTQGKQGRITYG